MNTAHKADFSADDKKTPTPLQRRAVVAAAWIASAIFGQTLFFKFSGAAESVYIFSKLGVEPWGRILAGFSELIASVALLIPRLRWFGALFGLGVISGALASHLFVLGIVVQDDGGLLFGLAVLVFACCAYVGWQERAEVIELVKKFRS